MMIRKYDIIITHTLIHYIMHTLHKDGIFQNFRSVKGKTVRLEKNC